jgi:hypothetical protein
MRAERQGKFRFDRQLFYARLRKKTPIAISTARPYVFNSAATSRPPVPRIAQAPNIGFTSYGEFVSDSARRASQQSST